MPINVLFAIAGGTLIALSLWPFIYNNTVWFRRLDESYIGPAGGIPLGLGSFLLCAHSNILLGVLLAAAACAADPGTRVLFGAPNKGSG